MDMIHTHTHTQTHARTNAHTHTLGRDARWHSAGAQSYIAPADELGSTPHLSLLRAPFSLSLSRARALSLNSVWLHRERSNLVLQPRPTADARILNQQREDLILNPEQEAWGRTVLDNLRQKNERM